MIKKLKICGFDFKIIYKQLVVENGDSCLGCCKSDNNVIEIKTNIVPQRENEVILHESIHAISDIMNMELNELQVNTFGVELINYIKNNKKFITKILEDK
jgi:hypothetical protein